MPKDEILELAKYVATNAPAWLTDSREGKVNVTKLAGGSLIVDEKQQELTKGVSYSYRTGPVQGLTNVSSNNLLYGNMALDQYKLPEPRHLDEKTINKLVDLAGEGKDKAQVKTELEKIQVSSLQGPELGSILNTVASHNQKEIYPILQSFVGGCHIEAVANEIGKGEQTKQYAVLTLTGDKQAETKGFGISDQYRTDKSNTTIKDVGDIDRPTVSVYKGHNDHIAQQMVVQTENKLDGKDKKLCITAGDAEKMVSFYKDTIGKGTPVAVNCTDGVDRTGMMMVGLQMLHQYNQGNDLTSKNPADQQKDLIKLVDDLRNDRGPYFLRGTADTATGVALGHLLIATQKRNDLQSKNGSESDLKAATVAVENAAQAFEETNDRKAPFSKKLAALDETKKVQQLSSDVKNDIVKIEKASVSEFLELSKKGYDISSFNQAGKNGYGFVVDKFLKDPHENLQDMRALLEIGEKKLITKWAQHSRKLDISQS